jgi:hypothetical protein
MKEEVPHVCALCNAPVVGKVLFGLFVPKRIGAQAHRRAFIYALCARCRTQADCLERVEEKITRETSVM